MCIKGAEVDSLFFLNTEKWLGVPKLLCFLPLGVKNHLVVMSVLTQFCEF